MPEPDLRGKRALVLGVESDAGRALAIALAEAGSSLAAVAAKDDPDSAFSAKRISSRIVKLGRQSQALAIDASIGTAVQVMTRQVAKELGGLDIAVACPDQRQTGPTERLSEAEWAKLVGVNLSSVFFACRSAAREMSRQSGGAIVIVSSAGDGAAYNALKAAAVELVVGLAGEYEGQDIQLNAIVYPEGDPPPELAARTLKVVAGESPPGQVLRIGGG